MVREGQTGDVTFVQEKGRPPPMEFHIHKKSPAKKPSRKILAFHVGTAFPYNIVLRFSDGRPRRLQTGFNENPSSPLTPTVNRNWMLSPAQNRPIKRYSCPIVVRWTNSETQRSDEGCIVSYGATVDLSGKYWPRCRSLRSLASKIQDRAESGTTSVFRSTR